MKIDRELFRLEKCIEKNDLVTARYIIERDINKFSSPEIRRRMSLAATVILDTVLKMREESNKKLYSRETQLIIQHINSLAKYCKFAEVKRFSYLHKDLLSDIKIYNLLNEDAKICIPKPKDEASN